jgi:hypothetical protein
MVRAAKRAVASRVNPGQRRVIKLSTTTTRGRFAESSGSTQGPTVVPLTDGGVRPVAPPPAYAQQQDPKQAADVQKKLKEVIAEQERMAAEEDEPYGGDMDEDEILKRASELAAEREKLEQSVNQRPPGR